jgi:hypothetical protein
MKVKTSITISEDNINLINNLLAPQGNMSEFIEKAIVHYINHIKKSERNANDYNILNNNADRLNLEAKDVLSYQINI